MMSSNVGREPLYGAAEGHDAAPPSRRNRAADITASASAITASATAALASVSASAVSAPAASPRRAACPRASTCMTINSPAQATTATTGPAAAVAMNAKQKLKTISRLFIIMEVKSACTASTLPRTRRWHPRHPRVIGAVGNSAHGRHRHQRLRPESHAPAYRPQVSRNKQIPRLVSKFNA